MVAWLERAFGMTERSSMKRPDGSVFHAEMAIGDGLVLIGSSRSDFRNPAKLGTTTASLYVYVDCVDAHHARARKAGAKVIEKPETQGYGDRRYAVSDPEGHHWYFASSQKP